MEYFRADRKFVCDFPLEQQTGEPKFLSLALPRLIHKPPPPSMVQSPMLF